MASAEANTLMSGGPSTINPKLRKRTKTGCLTCRKRRIKCGEERPICNNCIKSKRHCEGYNQRVIWKPPIGGLSGGYPGSASIPYTNTFLSGVPAANTRPVPPPILTQDPSFGQIPPREHDGFSEPQSAFQPYPGGPNAIPSAGPHSAPLFPSQNPFATENPTPFTPPQAHAFVQQQLPQHFPLPPPNLNTTPQLDPNAPYLQQYRPSPNFHPSWQQPQELPIYPHTPVSIPSNDGSTFAESGLPTPAPTLTSQSSDSLMFVKLEDGKPLIGDSIGNVRQLSAESTSSRYSDQQPQLKREGSHLTHPVNPSSMQLQTPPQVGVTVPFPGNYVSPTDMLDEAAVEYEDDDYFDVHSDEEIDIPPSQAVIRAYETQRDFGMIIALHRESTNELTMRHYNNFLKAGILDYYRADWVASPLRNEKTARVFAHFIFATGPTLSIFERHPRNASAIFDESPSPCSMQGLWTYTLPMMALNHQGLLHAMLALSSLHIAKLQQASITPSFKHYAYSLKRLRHCLSHPKKRHLPTALAATLLLGFYEVMTADHLKWSSHLLGAKQLLVEMDYHLMAKEARKLKAQAKQEDQFNFGLLDDSLMPSPINAQTDSSVIDENIISTIVGRKVKYDEFGQVIDESVVQKKPSDLPDPFDLSRYELYQDLFWWYAKQDAYHSIVGGNGLLLDYYRWADCPPRAAVNRPDAIYGTFDHLVLLLGRVADFQYRDRSRKIKAMEAAGGHWRPPPGFQFGAPPAGPPAPQGGAPPPPPQFTRQNSMPQTPTQAPQQPPPSGPRGPTFFGMAPMPSKLRMPSSYQPNGQSSPSSPESIKSDIDLSSATASALEEWSRIRAALDLFVSSLGPAFQSLSPEYHHQPAVESPFGGVLQYRSYDIAIIWAIFYMMHIILIRSHPHMPPAAMVAAGIAAPQTAHFARLIGQIAFGIVPTPRGQPLNPSLGATLCEVCMPLFFAGVQYQAAAQREWLVSRVRDIEARTGWASVGMIAHGCETAWEKAAEAGRGPPYQRLKVGEQVPMLSSDERVRQRGGHFDPILASEPPKDLSDRRFIHSYPATRVHWAMGLLSNDEDVREECY